MYTADVSAHNREGRICIQYFIPFYTIFISIWGSGPF